MYAVCQWLSTQWFTILVLIRFSHVSFPSEGLRWYMTCSFVTSDFVVHCCQSVKAECETNTNFCTIKRHQWAKIGLPACLTRSNLVWHMSTDWRCTFETTASGRLLESEHWSSESKLNPYRNSKIGDWTAIVAVAQMISYVKVLFAAISVWLWFSSGPQMHSIYY